MTVTQIIQLGADSAVNTANRDIADAVESFKRANGPENVVFGTQIQDKSIQITSEWDEVQTSPLSSISSLGAPSSFFHVSLDRSAFGSDGTGPAAANVVEYAQSYFPASLVTPAFKQQIEADFTKFDEIFRTEAVGGEALAVGWVIEEMDFDGVEGGKAKCFLVMRGWESMAQFGKSTETEAFKKCISILQGWEAPFKMRLMLYSGMLNAGPRQLGTTRDDIAFIDGSYVPGGTMTTSGFWIRKGSTEI